MEDAQGATAFAASVVLPVRDGEATVEEQLAALDAQDCVQPFEIIVVDNGSNDRSASIVERWSAGRQNARLIVEEKPGSPNARNAGCRAARARHLLFCEQDDIVSEAWVRLMLAGLDRFDLVGGALEYERLNDDPVLHSREHHQSERLPVLDEKSYAMTANLAVSRSAYEAVGGFDPFFRWAAGDIDFSWRVQLAGFRVGFVRDAVVHYRLRRSMIALMRQQYRYQRETERLIKRHRRAGTIAIGRRSRYMATMQRALKVIVDLPAIASENRRWRYVADVAKVGGSVSGLVRSGRFDTTAVRVPAPSRTRAHR
jgi:glycosyltransferase involved in cell wall biosynthesis